MKKINRLIIAIGILVSVGGCEATDPENLTFTNDREIYSNITKIRNVLNGVYSGLPNGYSDIGTSWLAAACDEAEEVNSAQAIQNFNIGNISAYFNPDDVWDKSYESIRNARVFIQSTDTITWSELEFSNPAEYNTRVELVKQYRAEAKFLEAFFYFELVKRYGGVPIVNEVINKDEEWLSRFPRKSFEESVDFIVASCDAAVPDLPANQNNGNLGRATKGAALALKARTLLYAASELYNQPTNADPLLGYTDANRTSRLIRAAQANKAIINFTPAYAFHANYQGISLLGSTKSNEVIFERRYGSSNTFEKEHSPIGFPLGQTGTCPSGNLVDAYEHLDDGNFNWNNPAHAANPYNRRDPRLAKTVVVNASNFGSGPSVVELFNGGLNGKPRDRASKTGYYLRKYINETLDLQLNQASTKQWIFMRYAEFYLNYAELMNELYGAEGTGPGTLNMSARAALNAVRTRAAVGLKAIPAGQSASVMRELIRRERRVELAFEGHRYWDVRRWMIADQTIGGSLRGVDIVKNANNTFSYNPVIVESRFWNNRLYFYPIPQAEINKSAGIIKQNAGW